MDTLTILKNNLIDKITAMENEQLLNALISILDNSKEDTKIYFSPEQLELLKMSEEDIKYGRVHSQEEVDKLDAEWIN